MERKFTSCNLNQIKYIDLPHFEITLRCRYSGQIDSKFAEVGSNYELYLWDINESVGHF